MSASTVIDAGPQRAATGSAANISRVPYLPGLDGMRALAVVAVMLYHANSTWLKGGFLGVEVFFVISGYLITLLLIAEHEKAGSVNLRNFWIRRFRRLLPAVFIMMVLLTVWTALFERDALGKLRGDVLGGAGYVSNWYQIFIGAGYSAGNDFVPLRHLWSLAVEEQFYLVWPIVMLLLLRKGSRQIADLGAWLFGGAVLVTVIVALLYHPGPIDAVPANTPGAYWSIGGRFISKADALYLSTLSRSSGLMLGAALAMVWRPLAVMRGPLRAKNRALDLLALIGFAVLALMCWKVGFISADGSNKADPWLFRGGFLLAGIATLLIIMAVTHPRSITSKALAGPTLLWIGTRSYGLYLYHWPIYQIVRNTAGTKLQFHEWVLCMVATAIITECSYRYVETPIRRGALSAMWKRRGERKRRPENRKALAGAVVVAAALAVFGVISLATAELKQNEVAQSLDEGQAAVCNVLEEDCFSTPADQAPDDGATPAADPGAPADESNPGGEAVPSEDGSTEAVPDTTVAPAPSRPARLALGDSVMLGAADELVAAGFVVDAEESRSFVRGIDVVRALSDSGLLPDQLVIHLGTNGEMTSSQMDQLMALITSVPQVLLIRNDVDFPYEAVNNNLMVNAASANPNVSVLYWDGLSGQCVGDCLYQDGIHLKSTGAAYYVQLINTVLAQS